MKAEHRKELETNILADKMGRMITGAKQGPSRGLFFYFVIAAVVGAAIFLGYRWFQTRGTKASDAWRMIEDGTRQEIQEVASQNPKTNAAKAARLQIVWQQFWFHGVKQLGRSPEQAFKMIDDAESEYRDLAKLCKGDPVFEPEALYGLAVIEETRLIREENRKGAKPLDQTIEKYQAVVKAGKDSAFGKLAAARLEQLNNDDDGRAILEFYNSLETILRRNRGPINFEALERLQQQIQQRKGGGPVAP